MSMTTRSHAKGTVQRKGPVQKDSEGGSTGGHTGGSSGSGTTEVLPRGIVTMVAVKKRRKKGEVIKVDFNEMGQPIGKEATTLAHFIGSCVRRTLPISVTNWQDKKWFDLKEQFWEEVKKTFTGIDESKKKEIIKRAGTLHRTFRTRLRNISRDSEGNFSDEPPFIYSHLSSVSLFWEEFVAYSSTLEFQGPPSKKKKMDKMSQNVSTSANKPILNSVESAFSAKRVGYPKNGDSPHDSMVLHILSFLPPNIMKEGIEVPMTKYFDGEPWSELIVAEHIKEILEEQWLSATSIAFYMRYLGEVYLSENNELDNKISFVSPHIVSMLGSARASNHLAECLQKYEGKDHLLLIPHNVRHHWVLVAINTSRETIYFMDPAPNAKISQRSVMKDFVESGIRGYRTLRGGNISKTAYNRFNWTNIQCPKQNDSIHCGHFVCCYMEDILISGDTTIPLYFVRKQPIKFYPPTKMEILRINWAGYFYNRFLKAKMR